MKLTKTLQLGTPNSNFLQNIELYVKALVPLLLVALLSAGIWFFGPLLSIKGFQPFAQRDMQLYVIAAMFSLWLLKFLLIDLDIPTPFQYNDAVTRKKLHDLQNRFHAVLQFLKKTNTATEGGFPLIELPNYLLLGPAGAGKTALLSQANVHFVLQRQVQIKDPQNLPSTECCEWWVTRDLSIIDVPGKYMCARGMGKSSKIYPVVWRFFLSLMKKFRGKNCINGIIIALPLPEIIKQNDPAKFQAFVNDLFNRLNDLQKVFPQKLNCQILITKSDLITGFNEFFSESSNDEINQAWGFALHDRKPDVKIQDFVIDRFDAMTKKLNQQLLWRLHQERNPMVRPYIKDFPLQIERLKDLLAEFIKQFDKALPHFNCQGVYLTSALQIQPETDDNIIDHQSDTTEKALQLFKPPHPLTRPYFIKQFLTLALESQAPVTYISRNRWKNYAAVAASIGIVSGAGYVMVKDFQLGIQQAYAIQGNIADYQVTLLQTRDPNEHLVKTIELLNALQKIVSNYEFKLDMHHIMKFYSFKAHEKAAVVYRQALQNVLLPEVKNYLADYLKHPVNKNNDMVYAVLKSYLMLSDPSHLDVNYLANTLEAITPNSLPANIRHSLSDHLALAFKGQWSPLTLDRNTIDDTRRYLSSIPNFDLSYIILKTYDNNSSNSDLRLLPENKQAFYLDKDITQLPMMFTFNNFARVYIQEAMLAATEAVNGNWVLGDNLGFNIQSESPLNVVDQLRTSYVNNYVDTWENIISNVHLQKPRNLKETSNLIEALTSNDSPLLQFLQTVHDNTYFEPVISASPKLQQVGMLSEKNAKAQQELYQVFTILRTLNSYLQTIQVASNEPKAAFEAVTVRMKSPGEPDLLNQLRLVASSKPEPIKRWLLAIADKSWQYLMEDASHYINTAWQDTVYQPYQTHIADRFPFADTDKEVDLQKFTEFFGSSGLVMNFYNTFLKQFIDVSPNEWHWKKIDGATLVQNEDVLRQIQQAVRIHDTFFPNNDNKLSLQFSLQPYKLNNQIKTIRFNINDKEFVDKTNSKSSHSMNWPIEGAFKAAAVQMRLKNNHSASMAYNGDWAWFKLVKNSLQNMLSRNELILNFSKQEKPTQYLLYTSGKLNPFLAINMQRFKLPADLNEIDKTTIINTEGKLYA